MQADDGIRDYKVTVVQTCALPILFDKDSPIVGQGVVDRVHAFEIIFERFAKVLLPWKVSTVSDPNRVCFRAEFLAQLDAFNVVFYRLASYCGIRVGQATEFV